MKLQNVFVEKINGAFGERGKQFLDELENQIERYRLKWDLQIGEPYTNLSYNYVTRATNREGHPVILKLGVPSYDFKNEVKTLEAYAGVGSVCLIKEDAAHGALLLEQLLPGNMLFVESESTAIEQFAKVWKEIRKPAPLNEEWTFPSILDWAKGLDRYIESYQNGNPPIRLDWVKEAKSIFQDSSSTNEWQLLHGDLHHENILYSDVHGWIAIDPKGVVGDPYFDLTSFLTNHLFETLHPNQTLRNRVDRLVKILYLDRERFLKASFAMAMLYACWGIEDQDHAGAMNTFKCAEWLKELISLHMR